MPWPKDYMGGPRKLGETRTVSHAQLLQQYQNGYRALEEWVAQIKAEAEADGKKVTIIDDSIIIEDKP